MTLVLELENVSKVYAGEPPVTALDSVSFSVVAGELVGVVGPSGSGKTTLLHLIGTLDRPTSGTVRITGMDVATLSDRELSRLRGSRIGFVFQQFFLAEHATVLDNVADGLFYAAYRSATTTRGTRGTAPGRPRRPTRRPSDPAVGRPTPAGRDRARTRRAPGDRACRRTYWQPRHLDRTSNSRLLEELTGPARPSSSSPTTATRSSDASPDRNARRAHRRRRRTRARGRKNDARHQHSTGSSGADPGPRTVAPASGRLRLVDLARLSSIGLRTRKLRAALSALGIAIGVAAIVAVLGLSSSSQAGLLSEIDKLGTNLLTVTNGQTVFGQAAELPVAAPGMISRIGPVTAVQATGSVTASVYRNPLIPVIQTNALSVLATTLDLPATVGTTLAAGTYLNAATATEPVAVLGASAASRLGIDRLYAGERIWAGKQWFYVVGILKPAVLAPELDAAMLIGFPAAKTYLGFDGHPSTIYLRANTDQVPAVQAVLAATADPEAPNQVNVSQPSAALVARAETKSALNGLFLGLGAVALLVGAIGVANIMVISVLERRSEIGLRRALGATKGHIRTQFLSEAIVLAVIGGAVGVATGALATAIYAHTKGWAIVVPTIAWGGGLGAALVIGAVAGLLPALRAARMSPTRALWSM